MDPERWRQIEELYQSAVDSEVAERATLLATRGRVAAGATHGAYPTGSVSVLRAALP